MATRKMMPENSTAIVEPSTAAVVWFKRDTIARGIHFTTVACVQLLIWSIFYKPIHYFPYIHLLQFANMISNALVHEFSAKNQ